MNIKNASPVQGEVSALADGRVVYMANNCETCEYYDYDEEFEEYICKIDMDEDEYLQFLTDKSRGCPYYKYYDEYKSVQKQN